MASRTSSHTSFLKDWVVQTHKGVDYFTCEIDRRPKCVGGENANLQVAFRFHIMFWHLVFPILVTFVARQTSVGEFPTCAIYCINSAISASGCSPDDVLALCPQHCIGIVVSISNALMRRSRGSNYNAMMTYKIHGISEVGLKIGYCSDRDLVIDG
jgi:hypothetical protein